MNQIDETLINGMVADVANSTITSASAQHSSTRVPLDDCWYATIIEMNNINEDSTTRILLKIETDIPSLLMDTDDVCRREEAYRHAFGSGTAVDSDVSGVALADLVVRVISEEAMKWNLDCESSDDAEKYGVLTIEPLSWNASLFGRGGRSQNMIQRKKLKVKGQDMNPFVLERTDVWCDKESLNLHAYLPIIITKVPFHEFSATNFQLLQTLRRLNFHSFLSSFQSIVIMRSMMHIAAINLQHNLRKQLSHMKRIAFVADGSILPRRSGASFKPMLNPPAIPFKAPEKSPMNRVLMIEMGDLFSYLPKYIFESFSAQDLSTLNGENRSSGPTQPTLDGSATKTCVIMSGLLVHEGVTLIVGGGYHGKSTLLRAISTGVYNKIPGDGREFCVTVNGAVSVRAEDGRYIHGCNISGFISNLPALPSSQDVTRQTEHIPQNMMLLKKHEEAPDEMTRYFKTNEASGSTSQAANVSEAIESQATCMLIDEDVSAANFMARDGRMRALVMDESITPLLYRVNGLFNSIKVSTIVVVGGVGDWLDVPHYVLKLDRYVISDATEKARSISAQFSYGHVQYAGRGVVHRLPWESGHMPHKRRPLNASSFTNSFIDVLPGLLSMNLIDLSNEDDDELGFGEIDMNRCEQLHGKGSQLYGVGVALKRVLQLATNDPTKGVSELIDCVETEINNQGLIRICSDTDLQHCRHSLGFLCRPRKHEVAMGLLRLRGMKFAEIPKEKIDEPEESEAGRQRRELAELWNNRRKNKK